MAIDRIPGVGPANSDIAAAVAAPSSATIASAVAASVPTIGAINTSVQTYASSKTMKRLTLTSGTSWTVPTGVTFVNVTLLGGGGGGASTSIYDRAGRDGMAGQVISSTLSATAGASIGYAIGAGGGGGATGGNSGATGGSTTFTGATTATGGNGARAIGSAQNAGTATSTGNNGGIGQNYDAGGAGGAGKIDIEYWT